MSLFILDTDIVSLFQHGDPKVAAKVQQYAPADVAITVLSVEEQLSGWYKELRRAKKPPQLANIYSRMSRTVQFFGRLRIFSFSEHAIHRYEKLRKQRLNIGKMDLRIAAVALEVNGIVVTRNTSDFGRIPGLTIEDWSK